ncbi:hypothetical protein [Fangia hongkongensis]|uniref:hypothetical protein n=1 Tax=Fangia hongkongensis TaxID=270495 RepID=UPI00036113C7|nr:hypothetical protein [Fangia hongkongensis]MBK2124908.1 hypothetical protein [Fangia hongkongensis]
MDGSQTYRGVAQKKMFGIVIMSIMSLIVFFLGLYDYLSIDSPINHTAGMRLVLISAVILFLLGVLCYLFRHLHARWERVVIYIISIILLLGVLFATYLLEAKILLVLSMIAIIGWLIQVLTK